MALSAAEISAQASPSRDQRTLHPTARGARRARWVIRPHDAAIARRLAEALRISPLVARILAGRGHSDPDATALFLRPSLGQMHDPHALLGMHAAVERLTAALDAREAIHIFGDYDVDGVTGTAILVLTLRELGHEPDYYIPDRLSEGYGLNCEALEELQRRGAQLVVSVDCGMTALAEAERACELGLDLIVTDHHTPAETLPRCVAVINPRQAGCNYPFKGLAGAGVAFKLAHALLKARHPDQVRAKEFLKSLLDLATLGTVADIVPLTGENRALVAHGLELLRATRRVGLHELFSRAGLDARTLDTGHIGYVVGPRLNAAGRTEHAMFGVELLLSTDRAEARKLAEQLEEFNLNRRAIEADMVREALVQLDEQAEIPEVLVVAQEGWHHGVLGIVASRLLARHYRPTIVVGIGEDGVAKGSGRSIAGFDLHAALHHCREHLTQFGGHTMAAGLTMAAEKLEDFRTAMNAYAAGVLTAEDYCPLVQIDSQASSADLTARTVEQLAALAPFGQDNPRPVIALEDFNLVEEPRILKERHLKLRLATRGGQTLTALGWNMAERAAELADCRGPLHLAGSPILNTWNGRTNVEIELKDFKLP